MPYLTAGALPLAIIFSAARLAFLRAVKLEAVVSIGFSFGDDDTHARRATEVQWWSDQSLCHVAVNEMRAAGPFSDRIESSVPSAVLQVLRWGRRSATLRSVFAARGPTSCFSPTRTGVLADLSRCKHLPGIAVNCALVWQQVTAAISGSTSGALAGPDNAGYRWLGRPTFRQLKSSSAQLSPAHFLRE